MATEQRVRKNFNSLYIQSQSCQFFKNPLLSFEETQQREV